MVDLTEFFPRRPRPRRRNVIEQGLGLLQITRSEAFGEPAVDRRKDVARFVVSVALQQHAGEAGRGAQLVRSRFLPLRDGEALAEMLVRSLRVGPRRQGQELARGPMQLRLSPGLVGPPRDRERL